MSDCSSICSLELSCSPPSLVNDALRVEDKGKSSTFTSNPWDFYTPFLKCGPSTCLVLCRDNKEVRTMRTFGIPSRRSQVGYSLFRIQHSSFIDIYEAYNFRGEIFAIVQYVGFSIEDLLQHSIYPSEAEMAYIVGQVHVPFGSP